IEVASSKHHKKIVLVTMERAYKPLGAANPGFNQRLVHCGIAHYKTDIIILADPLQFSWIALDDYKRCFGLDKLLDNVVACLCCAANNEMIVQLLDPFLHLPSPD